MTGLRLSPGWWLVVDALAAARLTVLVTRDRITDGARRRAGGWDGQHVRFARPRTYAFLSCPWCVGVWVAAGVTALTVAGRGWWQYPAAALAFSMIAGLLGEFSGAEE